MSTLNKTITPVAPGRYGYSLSDITAFSRASTGTYADRGGVIRTAAANMPRFDYDPANLGAPPALIIETAATNTIRWSEALDAATWSKVELSVTPAAMLAPNGTLSACKLVESANNVAHSLQGTVSQAANNYVSGSTYTTSVFAKAGERLGMQINVAGYPEANFNLQAGIISAVTPGNANFSGYSATMQDFGNGWYRCSVTRTCVLGIATTSARFYLLPSAAYATINAPAYAGDGVSGLYLWGVDCEQDQLSSYIQTGSAAVSRAADFASLIQYLANAPGSLTMSIDGNVISVTGALRDPLTRAVIISLFTWARARADDKLPGDERMGWWGDTYPAAAGDRTGSRLWLLSRSTITATTAQRAREYAQEALAWLVADGVASEVIVQAEREGLAQISLWCQIVRGNGSRIDIRFNDAWSFLNGI